MDRNRTALVAGWLSFLGLSETELCGTHGIPALAVIIVETPELINQEQRQTPLLRTNRNIYRHPLIIPLAVMHCCSRDSSWRARLSVAGNDWGLFFPSFAVDHGLRLFLALCSTADILLLFRDSVYLAGAQQPSIGEPKRIDMRSYNLNHNYGYRHLQAAARTYEFVSAFLKWGNY